MTTDETKTIIQLSSNFWICINVLYTHSPDGPFAPLYSEVITEFCPWANFIKEDSTVDQIKKTIKYTPSCPSYF